MRTRVYYDVHAELDEIGLCKTFTGQGAKYAAISYAKNNADQMTYVDRVSYDPWTDTWDYTCVWMADANKN